MLHDFGDIARNERLYSFFSRSGALLSALSDTTQFEMVKLWAQVRQAVKWAVGPSIESFTVRIKLSSLFVCMY